MQSWHRLRLMQALETLVIFYCNLYVVLCFTTIVGWYYFAKSMYVLFGEKMVKVYAIIVVLCVVVGSTLKVDLVWNMSDMFNGLMVPNNRNLTMYYACP